MESVRRTKKGVRRIKSRWSTVKGSRVSLRFSDSEYAMLVRRAVSRRLSVGLYLKWLVRSTVDRDGILEVARW